MGIVDASSGTPRIVERMGEATNALLASLSPEQRNQACFDFADQQERTTWYYTPVEREGLPLAQMDREQQRLAQQLVATGLSKTGYVTASTIMGLETTLDAREAWQRGGRGHDPLLFYVTLFGQPHDREPWGWRYEGHHISLNYTIVNGEIVAPTPTFFGANPADSQLSEVSWLRPLAGTEDLARALLHEFDQEQRTTAILASVAPSDVVLRNRPYVVEGALHLDQADEIRHWMQESDVSQEEVDALRFSRTPRGIAATSMKPKQREILETLTREYIQRMPDELAAMEWQQLEAAGLDDLHFAWAGGMERHQGHYYRIQGRRFVVEYDNTQNDANHIHSVWRNPNNDFGKDLLAHHYQHEHS